MDTLVVTKLDRLARSISDARAIADELTDRGVGLSLGGSVYNPADPMGRLFFNLLAVFAEFEVDLADTDEGRYAGSEGQRSPTRETAQTEEVDRVPPGRDVPLGTAYDGGARVSCSQSRARRSTERFNEQEEKTVTTKPAERTGPRLVFATTVA